MFLLYVAFLSSAPQCVTFSILRLAEVIANQGFAHMALQIGECICAFVASSIITEQMEFFNIRLSSLDICYCVTYHISQLWLGERTGLVVRASDSESGDLCSILGRVGVLFP